MVILAKEMQIERLSKLHRESNSFSFDASSPASFYLTFFSREMADLSCLLSAEEET